LDVALMMLVLHHLPEPKRVLAEAARALKPGGRLLILDMLPHEREEYRQTMGHVWLGFSEKQMTQWLHAAGFKEVRWRALPPEAKTKGPTLFVATARRLGV
jgi:ubiquinone/menaquinone biosynthesis C-methylase UbiE